LRAVRIAVELGFRIDEATLESISAMSRMLGTVAAERIRNEILKILAIERPSAGFELMIRTGLLGAFLPKQREGGLMRHRPSCNCTVSRHILEAVDLIRPDPLLRLAALFTGIACVGKDSICDLPGQEKEVALSARAVMERLRFGNREIDRVTGLVALHTSPSEYHPSWSDADLRRWMHRVGPERTDDIISLRRAEIAACNPGRTAELRRLSDLRRRIDLIAADDPVLDAAGLAVDGLKVMDVLGLTAGPEVGRIIEDLLEKVIDRPELNTEENLLQILEGMKRRRKG
jgi:poly(A) polymerase/tRNA nucleotidyltransferase (CCA-adding enzyme)